jgi:Tfp pilus assembly protein PilO
MYYRVWLEHSMPFWLHEKKVWRSVKGLPLLYKVVGSIVIPTVLLAGLIFLVHLPHKKLIQSRLQEYTQLLDQQKEFTVAAQRLSSLKEENQHLTTDFSGYVQHHQSLQQAIRFLIGAMSKVGLSCRGIIPQAVKDKDFYQRHLLRIQGKGTFKNFLEFLERINNSNRIIQWSSLMLQKNGKQGISFQGLVYVFRINQDEESDQA